MSVSSAPATEKVQLAVDDGTAMTAHVARPRVAARTTRGIIVFQEAFGVNDHIRDIAGRFADLGFTAVAPELYHRTNPGPLGYGNMDAVRPHSSAVTPETVAADVRAAYNWLAKDAGIGDNIVAIGYCMGGRVTYLANATVPLRAAAAYYGGSIAPALLSYAEKQHGPITMFWGGLDKNIPPDQHRAVADALTAAGKKHTQVVFSDAEHGFFCNERPSYNRDASRQAWALTQEFFRVAFGDD